MKGYGTSEPIHSMELDKFEKFVTSPEHWHKVFPPGDYIARIGYDAGGFQGSHNWIFDYEVFSIYGDKQEVCWFNDWMDGNIENRVLWILPMDDFIPDGSNVDNIISFFEDHAEAWESVIK